VGIHAGWWDIKTKKLNSVALVRERTIPTERPPQVGEVSANFCGWWDIGALLLIWKVGILESWKFRIF